MKNDDDAYSQSSDKSYMADQEDQANENNILEMLQNLINNTSN